MAKIIALACQQPEKLELPFSHWTPGTLAHESVARGLIVSVSVRQVGRYLKDMDLKPHQSRSWLNPTMNDPAQFAVEITMIYDVYHESNAAAERRIHVLSTDEKTGI